MVATPTAAILTGLKSFYDPLDFQVLSIPYLIKFDHVAKLVENGDQVFSLTLTNSETHYDIKGIHRLAKTAVTEAKEAAKILGLSTVVAPNGFIQNVGELSYNTSYMRWIEDLLTEKAIDTVFCHWALISIQII